MGWEVREGRKEGDRGIVTEGRESRNDKDMNNGGREEKYMKKEEVNE